MTATCNSQQGGATQQGEATIFLVSGDPVRREELNRQLHQKGFTTRLFASSHEVLHSVIPPPSTVLILTDFLLDASCVDLLHSLNRRNIHIPTIIVSNQKDIAKSVQAIRVGALDYLMEPVSSDELNESVCKALRATATPKQNLSPS